MYKYQYKEKAYAEEIMKSGFTSKYIKHELKILAKFWKVLGHKPKERKQMLYDFCNEHLEGFDRVLYFKMINSVLTHAANKKNILVDIENVSVSKKELEYISELGISHDYKKILFTLLVLDKLNKKYHEIRGETPSKEHYFGGHKKYKELVSLSNVKLKQIKQIHNIIGEFDKLGIVKITGNGNIKLSFIYELIKDDEIGSVVSTFDNIGMYYDLYTGANKVKKCECCGVPIKVKSNRSKYCEVCWKEKQKESWRESKRKQRDVQF